MGTDLATVAACLTPQKAEMALAILNAPDETALDDVTFESVSRFALEPCPAMPCAAQDEFRRVIMALAGVLKSARTSDEQGKLQLAMYWRALQDVELFRLQLAAEHFIKTAEWMPTPGQIRTQALTYVHPVYRAHARAGMFLRERRHRLFEERMLALRDRTLDQAALDALADHEREAALKRDLITPRPEGGVTYRTREALERWEAHQRDLMKQAQMENRKDE